MKTLLNIWIWGIIMTIPSFSQQNAFTLEQAVELALQQNLQVKKAENEIVKAKKKVWETTAMGFPQASANVSYQKFIDRPVTLLPARIFNPQAPDDQYIPVSFGTEQNMKWNFNVNQLIFSGSYITGLYSSKVYKQISELAAVKTKQRIKEIVTNTYVNAALADKNLEIIRQNIQVLKQNLHDTRAMFENGFVEETDVQQLEITLSELENQKKFLESMQQTAYEMLNYVMGRNPDETLTLLDNTETLIKKAEDINLLQANFHPEKNIDFQIAKNKVRSGKLKLRFEQSKLLPTIAAFYSYGKSAYNNDFKFFDNDQAWYEQSLIGININIPIFSSFQKSKRIGQARVDFLTAQDEFNDLQKKLQIEYHKLVSEYIHALEQTRTNRKNMKLAEEIARREEIKYKEGVGNSFQLNMARLQLYKTQQQYLNSIGQLLSKKIQLENFLNYEK